LPHATQTAFRETLARGAEMKNRPTGGEPVSSIQPTDGRINDGGASDDDGASASAPIVVICCSVSCRMRGARDSSVAHSSQAENCEVMPRRQPRVQ
jgi:hypothetical protein